MLESTFILTAFIATTLGVLDVGQVMYFHQGIVERVRHAASWSSRRAYDATEIRNVVLYNTETPSNNATPTFQHMTAAMVDVSLEDTGTPSARVMVRVKNYPYTFYSPWIARMYTARQITAVATHEPSLP